MSQIDIDLNLLKQRIAALEEQKRIEAEKEAEKKANPMRVLEVIIEEKKKQYIGFFHTGAYQESLGGYGGIQHCLIPAPKHVLIDRDESGEVRHWLFAEDQKEENMLKILGY